MKKAIFIITFIVVLLIFGRNLNPFSNSMFTFHDETQPARIQEFALNLRQLKIPPRLAPDFSFKMGYPVFNFYAPASYWITSIFSLFGLNTILALKLSFLLSILVGFVASFFFLKEYFDFFPSLTGSILYISALYYPVDIFVRGNLGEVWFLALFPLALFLLKKNSKEPSQLTFFFLVIALTLLFTVHNLLSIISIILILGYMQLLPHRKISLLSVIFFLFLSAYFMLPLITENHLTYATYVATQTKYADHFVCPYQLWQSSWGYGGSGSNCITGMSFKIGKPQLVFALLGILLFFWNLKKYKKKNKFSILHFLFFFFLTIGSLFMSTNLSKPVWDFFSPVLAIFQFPWRFIAFSLLGLSFFASYLFNSIKFKQINLLLPLLIIIVIVNQSKYFVGQTVTNENFQKTFLSKEHITKTVAYKIAEYLPKTANYINWRQFDGSSFDYSLPAQPTQSTIKVIKNTPFEKEFVIQTPDILYLNIHYFPFWKIFVDGSQYIPKKFDYLGRPILSLQKPSTILVAYQETNIEKFGDFLTLFSFIILLSIVRSKKLWNKLLS